MYIYSYEFIMSHLVLCVVYRGGSLHWRISSRAEFPRSNAQVGSKFQLGIKLLYHLYHFIYIFLS